MESAGQIPEMTPMVTGIQIFGSENMSSEDDETEESEDSEEEEEDNDEENS